MHTLLAQSPEVGSSLLHIALWLSGGSLAAFLGIWGSFIAFPPELVVGPAVDPSPTFNSSSRLPVTNSGKLAADSITASVANVCMTFGTMQMEGGTFGNMLPIIPRIAGGERVEIPILDAVRMEFPPSAVFARFSCRLVLAYEYRLIFFSKRALKSWDLELRQRPDGYSWIIKNV